MSHDSTEGEAESSPATEMYRTRADALATDVGDGPPLLFAHGTLMDRTMFRPQLDAQMVTVPQAGHYANLERPGPVNDAIRDLVGSAPR